MVLKYITTLIIIAENNQASSLPIAEGSLRLSIAMPHSTRH